jgi:hypothetical protein
MSEIAIRLNKHLYVLSTDDINQGDWVYNELSGIGKCTLHDREELDFVVKYLSEPHEVSEDVSSCHKVVSSTDKSLGLPIIV